MYKPFNERESEVGRDALLRSTLAYWSAGVHYEPEPDPLGWEAGRPDLAWAGGAVTVFVLAIVAVALWQIGL
jgi:hypothetical protein